MVVASSDSGDDAFYCCTKFSISGFPTSNISDPHADNIGIRKRGAGGAKTVQSVSVTAGRQCQKKYNVASAISGPKPPFYAMTSS